MKWSTKQMEECESTFIEARKLPAWSIVSSKRQTGGRGRFNRLWYADEGGLWANYNLPINPSQNTPWSMMPLVAGVALINTFKEYNLRDVRLRWPNDLLVKRNKLAGVLVERPSVDKVSIGIGVNVYNNLGNLYGKTTDSPTRLQDLLPNSCPSLGELRDRIANQIARTFTNFCDHGPAEVLEQLKSAWGCSLPVVAITDTQRICGFFNGIKPDGSPILRKADGTSVTVPAISINRLKELI